MPVWCHKVYLLTYALGQLIIPILIFIVLCFTVNSFGLSIALLQVFFFSLDVLHCGKNYFLPKITSLITTHLPYNIYKFEVIMWRWYGKRKREMSINNWKHQVTSRIKLLKAKILLELITFYDVISLGTKR